MRRRAVAVDNQGALSLDLGTEASEDAAANPTKTVANDVGILADANVAGEADAGSIGADREVRECLRAEAVRHEAHRAECEARWIIALWRRRGRAAIEEHLRLVAKLRGEDAAERLRAAARRAVGEGATAPGIPNAAA